MKDLKTEVEYIEIEGDLFSIRMQIPKEVVDFYKESALHTGDPYEIMRMVIDKAVASLSCPPLFPIFLSHWHNLSVALAGDSIMYQKDPTLVLMKTLEETIERMAKRDSQQ